MSVRGPAKHSGGYGPRRRSRFSSAFSCTRIAGCGPRPRRRSRPWATWPGRSCPTCSPQWPAPPSRSSRSRGTIRSSSRTANSRRRSSRGCCDRPSTTSIVVCSIQRFGPCRETPTAWPGPRSRTCSNTSSPSRTCGRSAPTSSPRPPPPAPPTPCFATRSAWPPSRCWPSTGFARGSRPGCSSPELRGGTAARRARARS